MSDRRRRGSLETEILAALWSAEGALTPEEVRSSLAEPLAYTTVQTVLVRLHEKGAVERRLKGRAYAYSPLLDEKDLAARRMRTLLESESDLDGVLSRFVAALDQDQAAALRRVLRISDPMIISCVLPMLIVASFGAFAPPLSRRVRPGFAIWMLSVGGLALTACSVVALGVVAALGLGQLAPLAYIGHWSPQRFGLGAPFQEWSIWTAVVVVALVAIRVASVSWVQGRRLRAAWSVSRAAPDGLVVLTDDEPYAYAVPGWPGRIVISRGLLRRLDSAGRRAVLAHERTHLAEHHDLHHMAVAIATAVNPLLFRSRAALHLACERRADEVAAQTVGHREAVARAITAAVGPNLETFAWGATGADVAVRVAALLSPAWDDRLVSRALLIATVGAVAMSTASVLWLGHDFRNLVIMARN